MSVMSVRRNMDSLGRQREAVSRRLRHKFTGEGEECQREGRRSVAIRG